MKAIPMILRLVALAALGSALAACSNRDEENAPAPTPSLTTAAVPTQAVDGTRLTEGQWSIEESGAGASAAFIAPGGDPLFVAVCDRASRALSLSRPGEELAATFRIETGAHKADVRLTPGAGARGVTATVDPSQPMFAAWTNPAAVIRISAPSTDPLALPGHAGIGRVIASCA